MKTSRALHLISLTAVLAVAIASYVRLPSLWKDGPASFATVGGFATFYGVIFAIIETWRGRAAAEEARTAVVIANRKLTNMYDVRSIAECQTCIRNALRDLDKDGWTSTSALSRIIELYAAEFHEAYCNAASEQREMVLALRSHAASPPGPLKSRPSNRLKQTLLRMLAELTVAASAKLSEKPE